VTMAAIPPLTLPPALQRRRPGMFFLICFLISLENVGINLFSLENLGISLFSLENVESSLENLEISLCSLENLEISLCSLVYFAVAAVGDVSSSSTITDLQSGNDHTSISNHIHF
jgi:hypothetical protein